MVSLGNLAATPSLTPFVVRQPLATTGTETVRPATPEAGVGAAGQGGPSGAPRETTPGTEAGTRVTGEEGRRGGDTGSGSGAGGAGASELSEEEQRVVRELKQRDAEVRRHEAAHASAGGSYAGPPSFEFQRGPDGGQYAVGGEVSIDTSVEDTPEETIRKMEIVRRAALAPADPSPQDLRVAADAQQKAAEAQAELRREEAEALTGDGESDGAEGPEISAGPAGRDGGNRDTAENPRAQERTGDPAAGVAGRAEDQGAEDEGGGGALDGLRQRAVAAYQAAAFRPAPLIAGGLLV